MKAPDNAGRSAAAEFLDQQVRKERQQRLAAEKIAEQLKQDMAALVSEFANSSDEETPEKLRKNLRARIPAALNVLDHLMVNGTDSLKANIAKWFVDRGLAVDLDPTSAEAAKLNKLLESLQG